VANFTALEKRHVAFLQNLIANINLNRSNLNRSDYLIAAR